MAENSRRRSAATATVGLAGVGGAAALRHEALVRSYDERGAKPVARPKLLAERRMIKLPSGRKIWLAGATLGAASLPAAATGVHGVLHGEASKRDDSFWREGVVGAKDAVIGRTQTATEGAPPKLVAGNYLAGAGVGSITGGLTHHALRHKKLPGHGKAALAAAAGATVGTAALPLQSKLTARYSRGKYEVTPTGVRRLKRKAKRPSSVATIVEGRAKYSTMHPAALREAMGPVDKVFNPKQPRDARGRFVATGGKAKMTPKAKARAKEWPEDIPEATFFGEYQPIDNKHAVGGEQIFEHKQTLKYPRKRVWSLVEADDESIMAVPGYRVVNVIGYVVTKKPWKTGDEQAIYMDMDDFDHPDAGEPWVNPRSLVEKDLVSTLKAPARVYNDVGARVGAHWTVQGLRLADKVDVPQRTKIPKTTRGKLVHTGRTKAANAVRSAALDVGSINDKDAMMRNTIHGHPRIGKSLTFGKLEYYGQDLSRGQKRARVMAAGAPPIIGDFAAAGAAASMAPPELRKKTAALQFGGSAAGQVAGSAAGAYGLVHAAKHPAIRRSVEQVNDSIDIGSNAARRRLGLKPKTGPGMMMRVAESKRTPSAVRSALRPLARNPKVAAVGALAGGFAGSQGGGWAGYGHALKLEERRNAARRRHSANPSARRGFGKREGRVLTPDEHKKQARKKKIAANVATFTGLTGTGALGALGGSKLLHARGAVKAAENLKSVQVPLLTAGAGVGGLGSFNFAAIQRKEAKAEQAQSGVRKGLIRVPGVRRAPSMRRAAIRQTRYPGGAIRTSTVRGGLA